MATANNTVAVNGKAVIKSPEIVDGDPEYDGRLIIYIIKGEEAY